MPMSCFQNGCSSIGVPAYVGPVLPALAFLPSLALGIVVAQPLLFVLYFARAFAARQPPAMKASDASLPGFFTGAFWGMGNFSAMFATVYLGQTIGFPLTQCCLILNGLWGILYCREIAGILPIGVFALGSVALLAGAGLDGMS